MCVAFVQHYGLCSSIPCEAAFHLHVLLYSVVAMEDNYILFLMGISGLSIGYDEQCCCEHSGYGFWLLYVHSCVKYKHREEWNCRANCSRGNISQFSKVKAPVFTSSATCEHSNCFTSLPTHVAPGLNFRHSGKCEVIAYSSFNGLFSQ